MPSYAVKIAGIDFRWTEEYAKLYKEKLVENGFHAKAVCFEKHWYVAYCYREFTKNEYEQILDDLFGRDKKNE